MIEVETRVLEGTPFENLPQRSNLFECYAMGLESLQEKQHVRGAQRGKPPASASGFGNREGELQKVGFQKSVGVEKIKVG